MKTISFNQKRGDSIRIEQDSEGNYIASVVKDQNYPSESVLHSVISEFSIEHALERLAEATKIKSKNWAKLPNWILI